MRINLDKIHSGFFLYTIPFIFRKSLLFISEFKSGPLKTVIGEEFDHIKFLAVKEGSKVRKNQQEYSHYSFRHFMIDTTRKMYQTKKSCTFDVYACTDRSKDLELIFKIIYDYENHSYQLNNLTKEKLSIFNVDRFQDEIIEDSQKIYHGWVYKRPRTSSKEKDELLKTHKFIHSITFDRDYSRCECIIAVNDIRAVLDKFSIFFDMSKIPYFHIHFRDNSHHLGYYQSCERRISLRNSLTFKPIMYKETFIHELYHHFFYTLLSGNKPVGVAHNPDNTKLYDLLKESETIVNYRENSKDKKKNKQFYEYYLRREEIIARFFEAYFTYKFFPDIPVKADYTKAEINKYEQALLKYLKPLLKENATSLAV